MTERIRESYDAVAAAYARRYDDELRHKPLDRALLAAFAEMARGVDSSLVPRVADLGCGPGHVAAALAALGVEAWGVDLSSRMLAAGRELHPEVTFLQASFAQLPVADESWDGITAFYALCHVDGDGLPAVAAEMHRTARPRAPVLLAFHVGAEVRHVDDLLDTGVDLDFHFHPLGEVTRVMAQAGFDVEATLQRGAVAGHEVETTRGYVLARRR